MHFPRQCCCEVWGVVDLEAIVDVRSWFDWQYSRDCRTGTNWHGVGSSSATLRCCQAAISWYSVNLCCLILLFGGRSFIIYKCYPGVCEKYLLFWKLTSSNMCIHVVILVVHKYSFYSDSNSQICYISNREKMYLI